MAHLVSTDVFKPGFEGRPTKTEKGTTVSEFTLEDVEFALRLLAYNNTKYTATSSILERDYGLKIHVNTLRQWVSSSYVQRYVEIQHELSGQINKKLGRQMTDIAAKALDAQNKLVDRVINTADHIEGEKAPAAAASMASVVTKNVESGALLDERPTQIVRHENPDAALEMLRSMGLIREAEKVEDVTEED